MEMVLIELEDLCNFLRLYLLPLESVQLNEVRLPLVSKLFLPLAHALLLPTESKVVQCLDYNILLEL